MTKYIYEYIVDYYGEDGKQTSSVGITIAENLKEAMANLFFTYGEDEIESISVHIADEGCVYEFEQTVTDDYVLKITQFEVKDMNKATD